MDGQESTIRCDIRACARCNGSHDALLFRTLSSPMDFGAGEGRTIYTHWALCPDNGEPIILRQSVQAV